MTEFKFLHSSGEHGEYDYIIAGAGCAGLSLAVHFINSGKFAEKKFLIVDKDSKQKNDRTWCFWEEEPGLFESIVYKEWASAWVHNNNFSKLLNLEPYQYKLIRGIDFYNYCLSIINKQPNFEMKFGEISELKSEDNKAFIKIAGEIFYADYIFNSISFAPPVLKPKEHHLLQHFKGWIIETDKPVFNSSEATLMDFRTSQEYGTAFVYVMPFSETKALVEYTLFTEKLLQPLQYEDGLKKYIQDVLKMEFYKISEKEFGVIPMTNHKFDAVDGHVIYIGTAGGQTKASSGYTFRFIQKHSARVVKNLIKRKNPFIALPAGPKRFRFYDSVLLQILKENKLPGNKIFTQLFKKNKPQQVLRFLDNESSIADELKIISTLPTLPFLKAAVKQW